MIFDNGCIVKSHIFSDSAAEKFITYLQYDFIVTVFLNIANRLAAGDGSGGRIVSAVIFFKIIVDIEFRSRQCRGDSSFADFIYFDCKSG